MPGEQHDAASKISEGLGTGGFEATTLHKVVYTFWPVPLLLAPDSVALSGRPPGPAWLHSGPLLDLVVTSATDSCQLQQSRSKSLDCFRRSLGAKLRSCRLHYAWMPLNTSRWELISSELLQVSPRCVDTSVGLKTQSRALGTRVDLSFKKHT